MTIARTGIWHADPAQTTQTVAADARRPPLVGALGDAAGSICSSLNAAPKKKIGLFALADSKKARSATKLRPRLQWAECCGEPCLFYYEKRFDGGKY